MVTVVRTIAAITLIGSALAAMVRYALTGRTPSDALAVLIAGSAIGVVLSYALGAAS